MKKYYTDEEWNRILNLSAENIYKEDVERLRPLSGLERVVTASIVIGLTIFAIYVTAY